MGMMKEQFMREQDAREESLRIECAEMREEIAQLTRLCSKLVRERDEMATALKGEQAHNEFLSDQLAQMRKGVAT